MNINLSEKYSDMFLTSRKRISANVEMVTPLMAKALIENQGTNRKIRKYGVDKIATDIMSGNWCVNGETIVISETGELKDGQHRCAAIIQANCPVPTVVIRGVPDDARVYDIGARRTSSDIAKLFLLDGAISKREVHAGVRALFTFREMFSGHYVHNLGSLLTDSELMRFLTDNSQLLQDAIDICHANSSKNITCKGGVIAATFCILSAGIPKDIMEPFFAVVTNGITDRSDMTPALSLARTLRNFRTGRGGPEAAFDNVSVTLLAADDYTHKVKRTKAYTPSKTNAPFFNSVLPILDKYQIVSGEA